MFNLHMALASRLFIQCSVMFRCYLRFVNCCTDKWIWMNESVCLVYLCISDTLYCWCHAINFGVLINHLFIGCYCCCICDGDNCRNFALAGFCVSSFSYLIVNTLGWLATWFIWVIAWPSLEATSLAAKRCIITQTTLLK